MEKNIAIIGMSGRFPEANSVADFFQNLCDGRDSVREISDERKSGTSVSMVERYMPLGYIDGIEFFDHEFFGISFSEAQNMDPHQRISLEVVYNALENTGYPVSFFRGTNTGVLVGDKELRYREHAVAFDPTLETGNLGAITAGRIARFFDLRGGASMVDTACSSSLVALHYACNELISGELDHALVCGADLILFPILYSSVRGVDIMAPDGKSKTFSASANGTGGGEAVVCVVLKSLARAKNDGDVIHGIIKATAINQDAGLSGSLTAPDSYAQADVIRKSWRKANVDPETITLIEAHGTGTKLGDPIEIRGMNLAFEQVTQKKHFCAVSAVKTNIGHTGSAAGLVGLVKTVLSLKHRVLFPSLHFDHPNPFIDFDNAAIFVNTKLKPWELPDDQTTRRAGVSSFGLSGTNCHVVLEEAVIQDTNADTTSRSLSHYLVAVSAKNGTALKKNVKALREFLDKTESTSLKEISYTSLFGRTHYAARFCVVTDSRQSLLESLSDYLDQGTLNTLTQSANVIFIFSDGGTIKGEVIDDLSNKFTEFKARFAECLACITDDMQRSDNFVRFAFQYAFYGLLQQFGVKSSKLIGDGVGKVVVAVLTGKKNLAEALKECMTYNGDDARNLFDRLRSLVESEKSLDRRLVFAEMGHLGNISTALCEMQDDHDFVLIDLSAQEHAFLSYIKNCYENNLIGETIPAIKDYPGRKIELPGYQFNQKRCWLKERSTLNVSEWFYQIDWVKQERTHESVAFSEKKVLVVADKHGLHHHLVDRLSKNGNTCFTVGLSDAAHAVDFTIKGNEEIEYSNLRRELHSAKFTPDAIVYLQCFDEVQTRQEMQLTTKIDPLFYLVKSFHADFHQRGFAFIVLSANASKVDANENISLSHALSQTFLKGLLVEYPQMAVNCIDVDFSTEVVRFDSLSEKIVQEISASSVVRFVAYRHDHRFVSSVKRIESKENRETKAIRDGGVYVVTGGARGIGFEIVSQLARKVNCKIIVVNRSQWPSDSTATTGSNGYFVSAEVADAFKMLTSTYGSTIEYMAADISIASEVEKISKYIREKYHGITGIIHCAGLPGNWGPIAYKDKRDFNETLKPKIQGTLALEQMASSDTEFFVSFSSLNAIVPQKNSIDYAMANAFQDAHAIDKTNSGCKFMSINWPGWRQTGMASTSELDSDLTIEASHGVAAFFEALTLAQSQALIINVDLEGFSVNPFFVVESSTQQILVATQPDKSRSSRTVDPTLSSTESVLKDIWMDVLKAISLDVEKSDFFEIGGHSLNGTQVINRIKKEFGVEIEFDIIFEYGTIKQLASFIDAVVRKGKVVDREGIPPVTFREYYDLSHSQRRLWIIDQLSEGQSAVYNLTGGYIFEGKDFSKDAFVDALSAVVARHESIRTSFAVIDGEPKQRIHLVDQSRFQVQVIDLMHFADPEKEAARLAADEATTSFNLESDCLFRAKLLSVAPEKFVFIFAIHHIISDGWSINILINEVLMFYHDFKDGQNSSIAPLKIHYKDFAAWQNTQLEHASIQKSHSFWMNLYSTKAPLLDLPADHARPLIKSYAGKTLHKSLDDTASQAFQNLCLQQGVTLFMGLFTALNTLIYRYTHASDIVIGTPVAGREHADLENQIGFYVNTLALRTKVLGAQSFQELLQIVKSNVLEAFAHQMYPFDRLVEELDQERSMSRSPLFDVMMVLQNTEVSLENNADKDLQDVMVDQFGTESKLSKYDLTFNFKEQNGSLSLGVEFSTDLFESWRIERMMIHFEQLIKSTVSNIQTPIADLEYLPVDEKTLVLESLSLDKRSHPEAKTVHSLFEEIVQESPDAVAVVFEDRKLTYAELNAQSNRLANLLRENYSVRQGDIVGIMLEQSERIPIGLLAILKSGAAYVPIDPHYPASRIAYLISDSQVKMIITDQALVSKLESSYKGNVFLLDQQLAILSTSDENVGEVNTAGDLAYLMYTSGSTGNPKGVLVEHRNIVRLVRDTNYVSFSSKDKLLQTCSLSFDVFTFECWGMLLNGGQFHILPHEKLVDPFLLKEKIDRDGITMMWFTSGWFNQLVDADITIFARLQCILVGGEALSPVHINKVRDQYPQVVLINGYGPTENTTFSLTHKIERSYTKSVPIGRPISNSEVYILDAGMQPVAIGVTGEIYVGGDGLARGYWQRPELSRERFLFHSFDVKVVRRLYKTGDVGRWLNDGIVEFLGRNDDQVKIRGYRIELAEIESVLACHPRIEEACVVVKMDGSEKFLIAYLRGEPPVSSAEAQEHLSQTLPAFMMPSQYFWMATFPLTANGKTDRRKLQMQDDHLQLATVVEYEAPATETERKLVELWQQVLNIDRVGISDNFFALGGHSLRAIKLVAQIYRQINLRVSLRDVFLYPTVQLLSRRISDFKATQFEAISTIEDQPYYPLSHAQKRLWVIDQLDGGSIAYNISGSYSFDSNLDPDALVRALNALVDRHESLRTNFVLVEGMPMQLIKSRSSAAFVVEPVDLTCFSEEAARRSLSDLSHAEKITPFDLASDALFRVKLARLPLGEYALIFTVHHIIADEWSIEVLVRDMLLFYEAEQSGKPHGLAPLKIQYKDFVQWQYGSLDEERLLRAQKYWIEQFNDEIPILEFPADRTRPAAKTYIGSVVHAMLGESITSKLKAQAQRNDATLFMLLLASVKVMLYRYTGQEDIVVGTPITGRNHPDLDDQIGFYLNTLAIRTKIKGEETFEEMLRALRDHMLEAYEHQSYPFDKLVNELDLDRDMSRSPFFDVFMVLQFAMDTGSGSQVARHIGATESDFAPDVVVSKFDLSFFFKEHDHGIEVAIEYNTDLYDRFRIENLLQHFCELLNQIADDRTNSIQNLSILDTETTRQLLKMSTGKVSVTECPDTLHAFVEQQAIKTPDAIAIVSHEKTLTYSELNAKANQLARLLQEKQDGVQPMIGIMVDRSEMMVVSILAILKTGAAYVPVDPSYPHDRIDFILNDSGVHLIVTETRYVAQLPAHLKKINLDTDNISDFTATNLHCACKTDDLAYIIYTSGSTGRPKGVEILHRNAVSLIAWGLDEFQDADFSITYATTSYCFDLSVFEIFYTLSVGKSLRVLRDGMAIKEYVDKDERVLINTVPSVVDAVLKDGANLQHVTVLNMAGEPIPIYIKQALDCEVMEIRNLYGPSEDTTYSTCYKFTNAHTTIPIGIPLINKSVFILDKHFNLLPIGVPGEIYIAGRGVAKGYLNQQTLTDSKFIDNPFGSGKMYKTGDIGKWMPDGNIDFLGRRDHQIKLRGYRIELKEIESSLLGFRGIENVRTVVKGVGEGKRLVTYYTGKQAVLTNELYDFLESKFPAYMIPSDIFYLKEFPVTPNGKIDRKALEAMDDVHTDATVGRTVPENENEELLLKIWKSVLVRNAVTLTENFFQVGGDSIKAIQIAAQLYKVGYHLDVRDIFRRSSIEKIATCIKPLQRIIDQDVVTGEVPLTPIQKAFFENRHPVPGHYNQAVMLHRQDGFDEEAVKVIFEKIVEHHDALRMTFRESGTGMIQYNNGTDVAIHLAVHDLRTKSDAADLLARGIDTVQQSIELENGPLMKLAIFQMDDGDRLLIVIHHLVVDGVSWRILFDDLRTLWQQYTSGSPLVLPLKTDSFKTWALMLQAQASAPSMLREKQYWNSLKVDPTKRLRKGDRGKGFVRDTDTISFSLDETQTTFLLTKVGTAYNTQINDILLGALSLSIKRIFSIDEVVIGLEGHGRESIVKDVDVSRTIGWFTSLFPVVLKSAYDNDISRHIRETKDQIHKIPGKGVGFGILRYLSEDHGRSSTIFSVQPEICFNYLGQFDEENASDELSMAGESAGHPMSLDNFADFAFDIIGLVSNGKLSLELRYDRIDFQAEVIKEFWNNYEYCLREVIAHCVNTVEKQSTPTDFFYQEMSIDELDSLFK